MLERDLEAVVLRRVLALRRFAMFENVDVAELAMVAQNAVETELAPGAEVARRGERLTAVHLVLDGCIVETPGPGRWSAHEVFGAIPLFADRPARVRAAAATLTHTLRVEAEDLAELLDDNFGVLVSAIRTVAAAVVARTSARPVPRLSPITPPLGLVDRLFLLRRQLPFARARVRALATLAHASQEIEWAAGSMIARAGELANGSYVLVDGDVRATGTTFQRAAVHPGEAIGLLETLAGHQHGATYEAASATRALASSSGALFDVLEDHTDLGLDMLATFSRELLDRAPPAQRR